MGRLLVKAKLLAMMMTLHRTTIIPGLLDMARMILILLDKIRKITSLG